MCLPGGIFEYLWNFPQKKIILKWWGKWEMFFVWPNFSQASESSSGPICLFLVQSSFHMNLLSQFNQNSTSCHHICSGSLSVTILQVIANPLGLSLVRILLAWFSQNLPRLPFMVPLGIFPSADSLSASWLLPLAHGIFGVELTSMLRSLTPYCHSLE